MIQYHKALRQEYRQNILWHKSQQCYLKSVSQDSKNKSKNKQGDLIKHVFAKETINKMKRQPTDGKKHLQTM